MAKLKPQPRLTKRHKEKIFLTTLLKLGPADIYEQAIRRREIYRDFMDIIAVAAPVWWASIDLSPPTRVVHISILWHEYVAWCVEQKKEQHGKALD